MDLLIIVYIEFRWNYVNNFLRVGIVNIVYKYIPTYLVIFTIIIEPIKRVYI